MENINIESALHGFQVLTEEQQNALATTPSHPTGLYGLLPSLPPSLEKFIHMCRDDRPERCWRDWHERNEGSTDDRRVDLRKECSTQKHRENAEKVKIKQKGVATKPIKSEDEENQRKHEKHANATKCVTRANG